MTVPLPPTLQKFVEDQVRAGRFTSPEEVVEAGLARLMLDPAPGGTEEELDDELLAALDEADAQIDRGEGIPLDQAFARLRAKHLNR
jgi:putative addiction module CopG family antidote